MRNIAIVIVAYNRPKSLERLLKSINRADYLSKSIPLIISIDYSGNGEVAKVAREFQWNYGEKTVVEHPNNLGLRDHVLYCGNLTKDFDGIIMLEDDLIVSPSFYSYVLKTFEKYEREEKVAGISLYTHLWNVCANRPFVPLSTGYDTYFMQFAQSWGQAWTSRMWGDFYNWYKENQDKKSNDIILPKNVENWPETSWLKYFIKYIVENNKYFVYPYISLTSNFTDVGTHNKIKNSSFNVPLLLGEIEKYNFPDLNHDKDTVKYDVFFENINFEFSDTNKSAKSAISIDLYGTKEIDSTADYLLTSKILPYKIINSYALQLRPHELNIIYKIEGNEIFLYDTRYVEKSINRNDKLQEINQIKYDIRNIPIKRLTKLNIFEIRNYFLRKISGINKWK